jgi:predicted CXXCH cytochrome family protein
MRTLLIALILFATIGAASAQTTKPAKPTTAVAMTNCTSGGCHAEVKQFKVVHGPVNVNACDACHKLDNAAEHKFSLARDRKETCTFCHQANTADMPVVHKPVAQGECLSCHNPHGGTTNKFIRGNTMKDLCNRCHQDKTKDMQVIHGPVAAGACGSCHKAHGSQYPKLLVATGTQLCFTCHTEMKQQLVEAKFKHKAVEQDCTNCHDPHASNYPKQIKKPPAQLCTSCHEHDKIKTAAVDSKFKHAPVMTDVACLNCHTAHGGDRPKLMRTDPLKVCMKCHADQQKDGDRVIPAVAEVLDPKTSKHGPIRDGTCNGCHNPHGSDVPRLLAKPYPEKFYQAFSLDNYALCFSCHDKQLVLAQTTTGLTNFRNGTENLHFVHVNKQDRGRSCYACHNTHASSHDLHVRDSVPYGQWNMPINFNKTQTGGSCAPGCHRELHYDRETPVEYPPKDNPPTPQPATQPASVAGGS